jgi:hypothetical protein
MNWLRILLWKLQLVRLCVLEDFDGELSLRIIRQAGWNSRTEVIGSAQRMGVTCRVWLLEGGYISGSSFVTRWHPWPFRSSVSEVKELHKLYAKESPSDRP